MQQKRTFISSVMSMASGTALAQVITILCAPMLTRLFPPEDFGVMALFVSIGGFVATISMCRYEAAVVLPKTHYGALRVLGLCLLLLGVTTLVSLLVFVFVPLLWDGFSLNESLGVWVYMMPLFVVIQGLRMVANNWNARKKQFSTVAVGNITRSTMTNGAKILVAKIFPRVGGGLVIGVLVGQLCETLYLLCYNMRAFVIAVKGFRFRAEREMFVRYIDFFKINTPHVLVDSLRNYVSPIVIAYFFSEQVLGYYSLMYSIIMLPVSFLGAAIAQVFYSNLAEKFSHKEDAYGMTKRVLGMNVLIPLLPSLLIYLWGAEMFAFVFGVEWVKAGEFASALSLYMYMYFVSTCISFIPLVIKKMKLAFYYGCGMNVAFFATICGGSMMKLDFLKILGGVNILVSFLTLVYVIHMMVVLKKINAHNIEQ